MKVTFFQRRPLPCGNNSIERVFASVRKYLPSDVQAVVATSRFVSRGVWRRLYDTVEALFRQGDVNHVTGDVNFLTLLLRKRKTLLTVTDCVALTRLSGLAWSVAFFLWLWLPVRRAGLVSVISEATKKELLRYVKCRPEKIRVIHCPCLSDFQPSPGSFCQARPRLLQVGTSPNKNILRVAEALQGVPCHLRIIGEPSPEQRARLEQCGVEYSSVAEISDEEVVAEYRRCDLVVFASTYEGFGMPIVEANAVGRPVVTSNILSMPEVAGDAACFVDPFAVDSIRRGILDVIEQPAYRAQLIRRGYENVRRFRPETIAAQYANLYRELASPGHAGLRRDKKAA